MRQVRLFVAVNFPDEVKRNLKLFMEDLKRLPSDVKWVKAENLHLTVHFLGEVPEDQVSAVAAALKKSVAGVAPFCLGLTGVGAFPAEERPRVLWAGVAGEIAALSRLCRQVQEKMGELGFEPEKRKFSPHLTLARIKSPLGFNVIMQKAKTTAGRQRSFGAARIVSVELMQSELKPKGPEYFVLASFPLSD